MKKLILLLIIGLIIVPNLFAQDDDCEEYQVTDEYIFNTRQYKDLNVSISYGLGDITISPNKKKDILKGYLTYDERKFKPTVTIESISSSGFLKIKTKKFKDWEPCKESFKDLEKHFDSELDLYLPPQIHTDLFLDFGLGNADIDLTGISITKLDIDCGLSDVNIDVNERNNASCESVSIENGLGDFSFFGLGNLGAEDVDINIGLGSADIDLSGKAIKDMDVNVDVGLGSLDMILPKNANIRIEVDASFLSSIDIYGLYQQKDRVWISPDWNKNYPTIEMDINVGMGSADIVIED